MSLKVWSTYSITVSFWLCILLTEQFHDVQSAPVDDETAELNEYLDDDIPRDWKSYFSEETLKKSYSESTGRGLFQGDIAGISTAKDVESKDRTDANSTLWTNQIVPYMFSDTLDERTKNFTEEAFRDMESKTCIRFVPKSYEDHFIYIARGAMCWSYVGRIPITPPAKDVILTNTSEVNINGKQQGTEKNVKQPGQPVSFFEGCQDGYGATQHELMHALGLIHEQARVDRDKYVWINKKNLAQDLQGQFDVDFRHFEEVDKASKDDFKEFPYDYNSVMHYPWNAFALNNKYPTIVPKQKDSTIGNRFQMSVRDIEKINLLYRCPETPKQTVISEDQDQYYTKTWQSKNFAQLCDGKRDTVAGWDEIPDICLRTCRKTNIQLVNKGSLKRLFNLPDSKRCISKTMLCDGIRAEDDVSQNTTSCRQYCKGDGYVAIAPTYQCIHFNALCDGKNDTNDGSDEVRSNCDFYCHNQDQYTSGEYFQLEPKGRCMRKEWLCDGHTKMAVDNSKNPEAWRCDGLPCDGLTFNEFDTTGVRSECEKYCKGSGYFLSGAPVRQCIHWKNLCDGIFNLNLRIPKRSSWDENPNNCIKACNEASGFEGQLFNMPGDRPQCKTKRSLCNGEADGEDDVGETPEFCVEQCVGSGFFPANDTKQCINVLDLCNGQPDTLNLWDEDAANCLANCVDSEGSLFNLPVPEAPRCMRKRSLCDGNEDPSVTISQKPETCKKYCTGNGYFSLEDGSSQCIHVNDLCDGTANARSGWDEKPENCLETCKSMNETLNGRLRVNSGTKRCTLI